MSEITQFVAKAKRYLRSAMRMMEDGDYDSAASRIYYAMFFCAESLLLTKNLRYSKHQGVHAFFNLHFIKTGELPEEMRIWLHDAFEDRQIADYISLSDFDYADTQDLLERAAQFIAHTETYLGQRGFLAGD